MNRTDPSASAKFSPPLWRLRNEYRVGHRPILPDVSFPMSGSGITLPVLGGIAQVPIAPLGRAHSFQMMYDAMSSPIMNVLLVPSATSVSFMVPYRMSARQKMPLPFSSPLRSFAEPVVGLTYGVLKLVSLVTPKKSVPRLSPLT